MKKQQQLLQFSLCTKRSIRSSLPRKVVDATTARPFSTTSTTQQPSSVEDSLKSSANFANNIKQFKHHSPSILLKTDIIRQFSTNRSNNNNDRNDDGNHKDREHRDDERNHNNNNNNSNNNNDNNNQNTSSNKNSKYFSYLLFGSSQLLLGGSLGVLAMAESPSASKIEKLLKGEKYDYSDEEGEEYESLNQGRAMHLERTWGDRWMRTIRAVVTVARICLDYGITLNSFWGYSEEELKELRKIVHKRSAERLLRACMKNGGIYMKAGQTIASMNNILPTEYVEVLRPCQDQAPSRSYEDIKKVFVKELGHDPEYFFAEFDPTPIAAASLAQVHKARLKNGDEVAVKVQYPGVRGRLHDDVQTIARLTHLVEWLFPEFKFGWLLDEFEETLPKELDFLREARNNERTANNFKHRPDVSTPKIIWDLTTSRVLTMEFVHGCKVNDLEGLKKIHADPKEVSRILSEVFSEQIFLYGFIHCDPHPGNILVRRRSKNIANSKHPKHTHTLFDKDGQLELVLLDHGLYRELTDDFRMDYCNLWKSVVTMNEEAIMFYAGKLGAKDAYKLFSSMLTSRDWDESNKGLMKEMTEEERQKLKRISFENIGGIIDVLANVPRQMLLLFKCNDLLRSVQYDLKVPLVYFSIMARIAQRGINDYTMKHTYGAKKAVQFVKGIYDAIALNLQLKYYMAMLYFLMFLSRTFNYNPVKNNLLMNQLKIIFEK